MRFESPGGDSSILQFKDSFGTVDPNSATGLGANWIQAVKKEAAAAVDPIGMTSAIITATNFDGANGFVVSTYAANPVTRWLRSLYVPVKGNFYQNLFGKTQHSQVQVLQVNGNFILSVAVGCCIYLSESVGSTGYFLDFETTNVGTTWRVRKAVADSFSGSLISGADVINGGDTLRLSVDLSVSGQATLTAKRNAVTLGTFVDSPAPITIGAPGLAVHIGDTGAGRAELRNFDGGGGL